mmetsp:Transcript_17100/g.39162  ORF Transcript_17100/g.39162 Transcript_17100/m.39162 type:complete len:119 (+) Transcript_17100:3275-3631(+)
MADTEGVGSRADAEGDASDDNGVAGEVTGAVCAGAVAGATTACGEAAGAVTKHAAGAEGVMNEDEAVTTCGAMPLFKAAAPNGTAAMETGQTAELQCAEAAGATCGAKTMAAAFVPAI